jgi:hypothetical protein
MGNPYTPIRRGLQRLLADVGQMLQDAILQELRHEAPGLRALAPAQEEKEAEASERPRRGRKPKVLAPPPAPLEPGDELPRPRRGRPPREPRIAGAGFEAAEGG